MSGDDPILVVDQLSKRFRVFHERHQSLKQSLLNFGRGNYEEFWALSDVSFSVGRGETFGIVGHNGSGKSTLLKCLTGILRPDRGQLHVNGSASALLELGAGFHEELSGRENVFLNAAIIGVPRRHIEERFDDIVEFSGLEPFIDTPVKNYSSGMLVRLGFAVAINVDPDLLIIDEVLAVGDAEFQAKCGDKIAEFRERGKTIVLVTHNATDVVRICQRAAWLDRGKLRMVGEPDHVMDSYLEHARSGRTSTEGEGHRWGDCVPVLGKVRLVADGVEVSQAYTGRPLTVRFHFESATPLVGTMFQFSITTQDGHAVTEIDSRGRRFEMPTIDGHTSVEFVIDALPLLAGTYDMSLELRDASGQRELDVWRGAFRFEVMSGDNHDHGVVTVGGTFRHRPL
jgi:ABC-2 type transport system ATP-binding protein